MPAEMAFFPRCASHDDQANSAASGGLARTTSRFISAEEALAAAQTGALPAAIAGIFDLLPAEQALAARLTWATMTEVYRADPLISAIVAAKVATAEQADELFRVAAGV